MCGQTKKNRKGGANSRYTLNRILICHFKLKQVIMYQKSFFIFYPNNKKEKSTRERIFLMYLLIIRFFLSFISSVDLFKNGRSPYCLRYCSSLSPWVEVIEEPRFLMERVKWSHVRDDTATKQRWRKRGAAASTKNVLGD